MTSKGQLGDGAEGFLQSQAAISCSSGLVDCDLWLLVHTQCMVCAMMGYCSAVFHQAQRVRISHRDGALGLFE
jgi:hypothetical protein